MANTTDRCLDGQLAIVTGAGGGIGIAMCRALAQAGADVLINDYGNIEGCAEAVAVVEEAGRQAHVHDANVRDNLLLRMDEEQWDSVLAVNLRGAFCCTKAVVRSMMKQRSGCLLFVSSVVGVMGNAGQANYAASKAGMIGLMKSVAKELAGRNIRANAIAPGFVDTAMTRALTEAQREELITHIPLGAIAAPEDVAEATVFLCSPAARYITGQVLGVDGGMAM